MNLIKLIESGNTKQLRKELKKNKKFVDTFDENGTSLLHHAAQSIYKYFF